MNKKGEGYVDTAIIIVVICLLLSVFLSFATVVNVVRINKRNTRNCLDSFVTANSVDIYNSVKTADSELDTIVSANFVSALTEYNTFIPEGDYLLRYDDDGNELYRISRPKVYFIEERTPKIAAEYELVIPFQLGKRNLTQAVVPITIKSLFEDKY